MLAYVTNSDNRARTVSQGFNETVFGKSGRLCKAKLGLDKVNFLL